MMSAQSTSASTLMETPIPDAVVNTSPNVTAEADATVQGPVASVLHSLSDSEISKPRSSTHAALSGTYPDSPTTRTLADVVTHLIGSSFQPTAIFSSYLSASLAVIQYLLNRCFWSVRLSFTFATLQFGHFYCLFVPT